MLTEESLAYYKEKDEEIPIQAIEMRVCSAIKYIEEGGEHEGFVFALSTPGRVYKFSAPTESERVQWIEAIKPFVEKGLLANLMKASKRSTLVGKPGSTPNTPAAADTEESAKLQPRTRANVDRAMSNLMKTGWLIKKGGTFKVSLSCFLLFISFLFFLVILLLICFLCHCRPGRRGGLCSKTASSCITRTRQKENCWDSLTLRSA